jgi:hypothetical protein
VLDTTDPRGQRTGSLTYTAETDAKLVSLRAKGRTFAEIGLELGMSKDQAQKRHRRIMGDLSKVAAIDNDYSPAFDSLGIRFYQLPDIPKPKRLPTAGVERALVAADYHFGEETYDPAAESIILQVAEDLQPQLYVANGDMPDLLALSRYPKDVRTDGPLEREIELTKAHYLQMRRVLPNARFVETNANHSGDGTESRWWRYLSANIPSALESPTLRDMLRYQNVFHDPALEIELLDHVEIVPGLIAIHGDVSRGHASYSARSMLEKWRVNLIMGHVHRIGRYGYRVPAVGSKGEHQMRAYEGGCMCKLTAPYLSVANWQQGFSIVHHDGEDFEVEQILIHNSKAIVPSLGKVYRG